jgi:aminoglycoside phosphotransferase (APT) family kinase protein
MPSGELAIVVLAAGRGTRFGGTKQLAALGPDGELMLDYALRDAAAAGFERAVIVASDETADALRSHLGLTCALPFSVVVQPSPRGTAHAVLVGARGLASSFAVANADDWYGPGAYRRLAEFLLGTDRDTARGAVLGYAAGATLSPGGGVSRAVCRVDGRGRLLGIAEHTGMRADDGRVVSDQGVLDAATPVSMNLWGFTPPCVDLLRPVVDAFLAACGDGELRLPDVVGELVASHGLAVTVLPTVEPWFGVTHAEDAAEVRTRLRDRARFEPRALDVASAFATTGAPVTAAPVAHGHIHETFVVACGDLRERIVLQRINTHVFRDLDALVDNWRRITAHTTRVARPVETRAGGLLHLDADGQPWRATRWVEHSRVLGIDASAAERRAAARAFAELTRDLADLGPLAETIPRFHDLARRRADLVASLTTDRAARAAELGELVATADRLAGAIVAALDVAGAADLPVRTVHNDAKLDNVLVDIGSGAVACIVDLDTVMPGTVLNDFGELVRTAATHVAEDEPDVARVDIDGSRFASLAAGYLEGSATYLTGVERACLPLAGPLLALENGVRFLTDHLDGDVYFRIHRPDHNRQRAAVQLRLAELMLDRVDELRAALA